jgi:hypothetical protein
MTFRYAFHCSTAKELLVLEFCGRQLDAEMVAREGIERIGLGCNLPEIRRAPRSYPTGYPYPILSKSETEPRTSREHRAPDFGIAYARVETTARAAQSVGVRTSGADYGGYEQSPSLSCQTLNRRGIPRKLSTHSMCIRTSHETDPQIER